MTGLITRHLHGARVNDSTEIACPADRAALRDAQAEIQDVTNDCEALIRRLVAAAEDHGCVFEQCTGAAEMVRAALSDEVRVAAWILDCALS